MNKLNLLFVVLLLFSACCSNQQLDKEKTITISGIVTDFNNQPIDSSIVQIKHSDFTNLYETYTDKNGYYAIEVEKGNYMALFAMRPKEYPRANAIPEAEMRLEYWAWNIVADRDLEINPRYDKLELYGTTVFNNFGGYNGFFIFFRPMSVTKYISYSKEMYLNKGEMEKIADISIKPEHLKVNVYADDELLKINSIQAIEEFGGENNITITAYIVQVDAPTNKTDKPYIIFRVEAENTEHHEKGENIYFYEKKKFK